MEQRSNLIDLLLAHIVIVILTVGRAITTDDKGLMILWIIASVIWGVNVIFDIKKINQV